MSEFEDNVLSFGDLMQRQATQRAQQAVGTNPDDAVKAMDISSGTGIPPMQVMSDPKAYQRDTEKQLVKFIVSNNEHLQSYINQDPIHASVSNGDWHNLDAVSRVLDKIRGPTTVMDAVMAGMKKGYDPENPPGDWVFKMPTDAEIALHAAQDNLTPEQEKQYWESTVALAQRHPKAAKQIGMLMDAPGRLMSTFFGGAEGGIRQFGKTFLGLDDTSADDFTKGLMSGLEFMMTDTSAMHLGHEVVEHVSAAHALAKEFNDGKRVDIRALAPQLEAQRSVAAAYTKSGEPIPAGLSPIVDEVHKAQTVADISALDEALDASVKSGTRERSAVVFGKFAERKVGTSSIEIPAEVIDQLYAGKAPAPDDGILGWVPEIETQLEAARESGGKVDIPIKDWLANVEPEVAKALHDDIAREGGYSINDLKQPRDYKPAGVSPGGSEARANEDVALSLARDEAGLNNFTRPESAEGLMEVRPEETAAKGQALQAEIDRLKAENEGLKQQAQQYPGSNAAAIAANDASQKSLLRQVAALPKELFTGRMKLGMTTEMYERWLRWMRDRSDIDKGRMVERAEREIRREETDKFREARKRLEPEAKASVFERPDIAADEFLRRGYHRGTILKDSYRLDRDSLTKAQLAGLRSDQLEAKGVKGFTPDDIANLFGFDTGEAAITRLHILNAARDAKKMLPWEYREHLAKQELAARLKAELGDLDENVMQRAREHAISKSQLEMIHEELLAMKMRSAQSAGAAGELPVDKAYLQRWAYKMYSQTMFKQMTQVKMFKQMGKLAAEVERLLMVGKEFEAFRAKQKYYVTGLMADMAGAFERRRGAFERIAKQYSKREVKDRPAEYVNWIHDMLDRVGRPPNRLPGDIQREIQAHDEKTLKDFIEMKVRAGRDLGASDLLLDPTFRKPIESMNVRDADEVMKTLQLFANNAREEGRLNAAGKKMDLNEAKDDLKAGLERLSLKKQPLSLEHTPTLKYAITKFGVDLLQISKILERWDKGEPFGPWSQLFWRPLAEASSEKQGLIRDFAKKLKALKDDVSMETKVANPIFRYQGGLNDGDLIPFKRENLLAIMHYRGDPGSFEKLAAGFKLRTDQVDAWLHTVATKEDWAFVRGLGQIYEELWDKAALKYRERNGMAPERVPLQQFATMYGMEDGWYAPIRHSSLMMREKGSESALIQIGYHHTVTPNGHFMRRTQDVRPLDLTMKTIGNHIDAYIHDIAFRDAVLNADKILSDNGIKQAIINHAGLEYKKMLPDWLSRVANDANVNGERLNQIDKVVEGLRRNAITTYIAFNLGTVEKHGPTAFFQSMAQVGSVRFSKAVGAIMGDAGRVAQDRYINFVLDNSEVVRNRMRNYEETSGGATRATFGDTWRDRFHSAQDFVNWLGTKPVALADYASTFPVWLAEYQRVMEERGVHGDAVYAADRAVKSAHGSVAEVDRPMLMQTRSPWIKTVTSMYGFFNHMWQHYFEMYWRAGELNQMRKEEGLGAALKESGALGTKFFFYFILPAVIEEWVTPSLSKDKHGGWGRYMGEIALHGATATLPVVRDIAHALINNMDPTIGLLQSAIEEPKKFASDLMKHQPLSRHNVGKLLKDGATTMGMLSGLVPAQVGRTAEGIQRLASGEERARGPWGWLMAMRYGTIKNHPPTMYDQFMTSKVQH